MKICSKCKKEYPTTAEHFYRNSKHKVIVNKDGTTEVVDVKGVETQVFKIKKKMFEYMYPDLSIKNC